MLQNKKLYVYLHHVTKVMRCSAEWPLAREGKPSHRIYYALYKRRTAPFSNTHTSLIEWWKFLSFNLSPILLKIKRSEQPLVFLIMR